MEKIITKKSFPQWVKKLSGYTVYFPEPDDEKWSFTEVADPAALANDYTNTVKTVKSFIFPQREVLFEFEHPVKGLPVIKESLPDQGPFIIFGVRPCDARAVLLTDNVFLEDTPDQYYNSRRQRAVIVGVSCHIIPTQNCFCTSVEGSPVGSDGMDIIMTDIGDSYHLKTITDKGAELLNLAKDLFQESGQKEARLLEKLKEQTHAAVEKSISDTKKLSSTLEDQFDSDAWEDLASSCIKCGICTYLCPSCHCFDLNDEVESAFPLKGKRTRNWDNCQFPDFTMHSSGHNPRPDKASRLRRRILHKFLYFKEKYGSYQCTGCGRCISNCPVGIDITEVLERVQDYE